jgi:hypothetical protein
MKMPLGLAVAALMLLLAGCGQDSSTNPTNAATNAASPTSAGSIATAPVDYLQTITRQEQTAVKSLDASKLNEDTQLFNAQEGRYPKDLNELVEKKYIARIPDLPVGYKYQYDPVKGKVEVVKQ